MDDKELEKILKESTEKTEIRSFSSRWKEIKRMMSVPKKNNRKILKFSIALAISCCLIALAIILPFALLPANDIPYYKPNDVYFETTSLEEFQAEMESVNIDLVELSSFQAEVYYIARSSDLVVRGGRIIYNNLEGLTENIFAITFYSLGVSFDESDFAVLTDEVLIGNTKIIFETAEEDLYESRAFFVYKDVSYIVEYSSLNDDFIEFLSTLIRNN